MSQTTRQRQVWGSRNVSERTRYREQTWVQTSNRLLWICLCPNVKSSSLPIYTQQVFCLHVPVLMWFCVCICSTAKTLVCVKSSGGIQCPNISALQEVRNCNDHPCTVYHWQTGSWGQCIEDSSIPATNTSAGRARGDDASCSVGMQTRKVICVRVNVGQVPPKK